MSPATKPDSADDDKRTIGRFREGFADPAVILRRRRRQHLAGDLPSSLSPEWRESAQCRNSSRAVQRAELCRFLDAGGTKPLGTLGEPASKKRRGTKSRGVWGRVGSQRYGDLIFAPIMTVGAKLAPGGLDRVRKGSWKRALGISVAAWGVSTGGRIVDWRGFAERDRRRRRASAAERESGGARRRSGS